MLEKIIAVSVALVVGGGLLTLVYRILRGDTEAKRAERSLAALIKDKPAK